MTVRTCSKRCKAPGIGEEPMSDELKQRSRRRLTGMGVVCCLLYTLCWVAVIAAPVYAPHSFLAGLARSREGRGYAFAALTLGLMIGGYTLDRLGYPLYHYERQTDGRQGS